MDKFLEDCFSGDQETINWLWTALGYFLLGAPKAEEMFLFLQGVRGTGKSTFLDIYADVFGSYHKIVAARTFIKQSNAYDEHLTERANLDGPRLVSFHETGNRKNDSFSDEVVNSIVSGERQSARFMRRDLFEFNPVCSIICVSNFRPRTSGPESGIHRPPQARPVRQPAETINRPIQTASPMRHCEIASLPRKGRRSQPSCSNPPMIGTRRRGPASAY